MNFYSDEQWLDWVERLSQDDYVIIDKFVPDDLYHKIRSFFQQHLLKNDFSKAGIGALSEYQIKNSIRGDFVYWLDKKRDTELANFFQLVDHIIQKINELCYLSLSGFEFHLAHYPAGSFYKKHVDQFRNRNNRMITIIIYLNDHWLPGDGGELKIFKDSGKEILIEPVGGRCILFRSATLEHEVLITNKNRLSLTGWLLYQPSSVGYLLG